MRNKRLDILRCIAVLLVLQAHSGIPGQLTLAGRVGVDLFFVLSGFLISGLLFAEYKKRGSIDFRRFFIRRSLKIYPGFYFLLLASFMYQIRFHQIAPLTRYLGEILYVQNYGSLIWGHEWSLAVEEHFYILLPILLLLLIRRGREKTDPFTALPLIFVGVAATCLALRIATVASLPAAKLNQWEGYRWAYATTHCRMDGLFFGVLLGYYQHYRPDVYERLLARRHYVLPLALLAVALLLPCLILAPENPLMVTAGLTSLYLGFGLVLVLSLHLYGILPKAMRKPFSAVGSALAYAGMYSYSIYLWHLPVKVWGFTFLEKMLHVNPGRWTGFSVYVICSLGFGIFMSRILEYPILRLRDRMFPTKSQAAPVHAGQAREVSVASSPTAP